MRESLLTRGRMAAVVLSAALTAFGPAVEAQVPAGLELHVNTYTTDGQSASAASVDGNGNIVVVWRSRLQDGSDAGIFGQRISPAGAMIGSEFRVNVETLGHQWNPAVAAAPDGSFVVAWQGPNYTDPDVFARRFSASGSPVGTEFRVNSYVTGAQQYPALAFTGGGEFVVVWTSDGQDGHLDGIFGQRYAADGGPLGGEFRVNTYTLWSQVRPAVASDGTGSFVVVWKGVDPVVPGGHILAQRFAGGNRVGAEFRVDDAMASVGGPAVAMDPIGRFVVAWTAAPGNQADVAARRFDSSGAPLGGDFTANTYTTDGQSSPGVAIDEAGNFVITWSGEDDSQGGVFGQRFAASGARRGAEFQVNTATSGAQVGGRSVASDPHGNFFVSWTTFDATGGEVFAQRFGGLVPAALSVDTVAVGGSDGNGILEPGEAAVIAPGWRNLNGAALTFDGLASSLFGHPPWTFTMPDASASYGTVANGAIGTCLAPSGCYRIHVDTGGAPRLSTHLHATFEEEILPVSLGQSKLWELHIGDSFQDVPRSSPFYRFVETLTHQGFFQGCTPTEFCPEQPLTREGMAVIVLLAKEGPLYNPPPACATMFSDVPASSPFCPWIEELARRGVVGGCGGGNYCPDDPVTRQQMSVFVLAAQEPGVVPPACGTPAFADVPVTSPFCRWIAELARRGVVSGCGGGNYCPTTAVTRQQMAVFATVTFGLVLYGP